MAFETRNVATDSALSLRVERFISFQVRRPDWFSASVPRARPFQRIPPTHRGFSHGLWQASLRSPTALRVPRCVRALSIALGLGKRSSFKTRFRRSASLYARPWRSSTGVAPAESQDLLVQATARVCHLTLRSSGLSASAAKLGSVLLHRFRYFESAVGGQPLNSFR